MTEEMSPILMYARGGLICLENEKQRLFNAYPLYNTTDKELLLQLFPNRTWEALKSQAKVCRIPRSNQHWKPYEDKTIIKLKQEGNTYKEISEQLPFRTEASIKNRMWRLRNNPHPSTPLT